MRKNLVYLAAFIGLVFSSASHAQEPPAASKPVQATPDLTNSDQLDSWMTYYYESPQPDLVPAAYRAALDGSHARLEKNMQPWSAFFAEVFRHNPERIAGWCKELEAVPAEERQLLWMALWLADTEQARAALKDRAAAAPDDERAWIERRMARRPTNLLEQEPRSPEWLDMLWLSFMAGGDERYVVKLIEIVDIPEKEELPQLDDGKVDGAPLMLHGAANWSVRANAFQHEKVYRICKEQHAKQPPRVREELGRIIEQVERRRAKETSPDPALRKSGDEPAKPSPAPSSK